MVSTLARNVESSGSTDGSGTAARFDHPYEIARDSAGSLYVTDMASDTIRKITLSQR